MMIGHGSREQILQAYRDVRDGLFRPHQAAFRPRRRADSLGENRAGGARQLAGSR